MVYGGKPSRGCLNCKKSHIKCDELSPACSACVRKRIACPGYPNSFDLFFRDQTTSVKEKVQRKHQKKQASLPVRETVKVNLGRVRSQFDQLLNVRSIDDLVPRTLKETPEEVALSSWFSSMILCEKDAQYARGFLHYLLPVYTSAKNDSALCLATSALAMLIAGGRPRFRAFFNMGRAYFGDALRLTSKALQHPIDSKSDETLMAVLVLGMGESIIALAESRRRSNDHLRGASALIKHRGKQNFDNDISRRLFTAVQTQLVNSPLYQSFVSDDFTKQWEHEIKSLPQNTATTLTSISEELALLQVSAQNIFSSSTLAAFHPRFPDLVQQTFEIDGKLADWAQNVPENWTPVPASDPPPVMLKEFQAFKDAIDIYPNIWILSILNTYRLTRITAQLLVMACLAASQVARPSTLPFGPEAYVNIIQRLADEICASLPYCVGDRVSGDFDIEVKYPTAQNTSAPVNHEQMPLAPRVWFIIPPLVGLLDVSIVPPNQKVWILRQVARLKGFYDIYDPPQIQQMQRARLKIGEKGGSSLPSDLNKVPPLVKDVFPIT